MRVVKQEIKMSLEQQETFLKLQTQRTWSPRLPVKNHMSHPWPTGPSVRISALWISGLPAHHQYENSPLLYISLTMGSKGLHYAHPILTPLPASRIPTVSLVSPKETYKTSNLSIMYTLKHAIYMGNSMDFQILHSITTKQSKWTF